MDRMSFEEVDEGLTGLAWKRVDNELVLELTMADFASALEFVNRVGVLAEEVNHHPDIDIRWNRVVLRLTTHTMGALTRKDLELAKMISSL